MKNQLILIIQMLELFVKEIIISKIPKDKYFDATDLMDILVMKT